ncbi:MAG: hypothetical protein EOO88_01010 [Pedobacter sp.]|nr:MAG: hypothetical protein EOO88_01010 [Pedobacter sp.]
MRTPIKLILCLLMWPALIPSAKGVEISFNRITNGLTTNFINTVVQTTDGYIWVGTQNGLQRYDGYRFMQVGKLANGKGIPSLPVDQLLSCPDPSLLMVRMGHRIGLLNINTLQFTPCRISTKLPEFEGHNLRLIKTAKQIHLIIATKEILTFEPRDNSFSIQKGLLYYPDNLKPTAIQEDGNGNIWIGGRNGIGFFDPVGKKFHGSESIQKLKGSLRELARVKDITHFMIDSKGRFFINCWPEDGPFKIVMCDPSTLGLVNIPTMHKPGSTYNELSSFFESQGRLWGFGIDTFSVFEERSKSFKNFFDFNNLDYGISVNQVVQLFSDRDKNIWVATDNGLYTMTLLGNHIKNGMVGEVLKKGPITSIAPLPGGRILFGSWGSGIAVHRYDAQLNLIPDQDLTTQISSGIPRNDRFFNMVWAAGREESSAKLYIACQAGRLIEYNEITKTSKFLTPKAFMGQTIRSLGTDPKGKMWFGTHGGLLVRSERGLYQTIADLKSSITKIIPGSNGSIWVATDGNGIFEIEVSSFRQLTHLTVRDNEKGLSTNRISDIALIDNVALAIAGISGFDLFELNSKTIRQFNAYNGLPQGVVTTLVVDRSGQLWMGTNGGICKFDLRSQDFKMFDKRTGFLNVSSAANLMHHSVVLPDGKIAINGETNFVIFDPKKLNRSVPARKITITEFRLFDRVIPMDSIRRIGMLKLKHDQNFINVSFAPLAYGGGVDLKYFYRLQGASTDWIKSENGLSATFASLKPGRYVFMVRSQNPDGLFSKTTSLSFQIEPAFYQSWWFVGILILAALACIYIIYRSRIQRLLEVHYLREKVARDLHDDVGSTLTSINILSEVASRSIQGDTLTKEYLQKIGKSSTQMMESMDDIVWSIKPDNDKLSRISARMREYTASTLEPLDIRYSFEANERIRELKLGMEERRNLFLIFKEALSNISKYSQATLVEISISYQGSTIILQIKDNGKGFDADSASSGNGLMNMRKRSEMLRGSIQITSQQGKGTEIVLQIPVKNHINM